VSAVTLLVIDPVPSAFCPLSLHDALPIFCDGAEKRRTLLEVASLLGIEPAQCIAMGDGSNDLPMMGAAGLSVAYHAKPVVREQRSEEHTSELQSRENLVCRLLLEKKKIRR